MFKQPIIKTATKARASQPFFILLVGAFLILLSTHLALAQSGTAENPPAPDNETSEAGVVFGDVKYLPLLAKSFPMTLDAPSLNPISNADGDGNYSVNWSSPAGTDTYRLQEDDNAAFSSPSEAYVGANTSTSLSGKAVGTYYYRVRGENAYASSGWSNVESTAVTVIPPSCPETVAWVGTTSQERIIYFEVDDSPQCQIAAGSLGVSFKDSCGSNRTTVFTDEIPVTNNHFDTGVSASTQVTGDFTTPTTASGTFSYDSGSCTASGSWTAAYNRGANNPVRALLVQPDGKILVGGDFTTLGGKRRSHLGRLNADGSLDASFNPVVNDDVLALALQADGKILVGGRFTRIDGVVRYYIARLNADGSLDTAFKPGSQGSYWRVEAIAVQADGKIVVGGRFEYMGGAARDYIARINADGSLDTAFDPGSGGIVHALAMHTDNKILVGVWAYLDFNSESPIHRLNSDGSLDATFDVVASGANNDTHVYSFLVQPDGKIVVGGHYLELNGVSAKGIGRLNSDGSVDGSFDPGSTFSYPSIYQLGRQSDGKLLVGGNITGGVARLNTDGSLDTTFSGDASSTVYAMSVQADDKVVVGGVFTELNGETRYYIGRLNADGTLDVSFP